ncbi:MAG: hypothetical protein MJY66_06650 [Bacteroidaceae bacterium]|nr:hypothetical protein [Bacteroidaceae bacterium]
MKKLFLAATALLTCLAAGAQTWIGGSVGLGLNGYGISEETITDSHNNVQTSSRVYPWSETEKVLSVSPTIGRVINENVDAGASVSFAHFRNINGFRGSKYTDITVSPFVRYTFWDNGVRFEKGDVTAFVQANVFFSTNLQRNDFPMLYGSVSSFHTSEADCKSYGLGVAPGIKYQMTERISWAATFGWLGWQTHNVTAKPYTGTERAERKTYKTSMFGLDLSSALNIGMYYSF